MTPVLNDEPTTMTVEPDTVTPRRVLATRGALLSAAREVFAAHGFERATITEIVERSGTSTGSLYNRFGGKEGLFLELHRQHSALLWDKAHDAIDVARDDGAADTLDVYLVAVRAFLLACWDERDLARLFLAGGGPPGFDAQALDGRRRWIDENADLLAIADRAYGRRLAAAVTGLVSAGAQQIVDCPDRVQAADTADYFAMLVGRLVDGDAGTGEAP